MPPLVVGCCVAASSLILLMLFGATARVNNRLDQERAQESVFIAVSVGMVAALLIARP